MNQDKSYTPQESAQNVARLKTMFHGPYRPQGYVDYAKARDAINRQETAVGFFREPKKAPPDVSGQAFQNFTEMLAAFREFEPVGDWLFVVRGNTPGYRRPACFIDTPCIEKAIEWHNSQGHGGAI